MTALSWRYWVYMARGGGVGDEWRRLHVPEVWDTVPCRGTSHEAIREGLVLEVSLAEYQPVVFGTSVNFGSQRLETGAPVLAAFWFRSYLIVLHAVDDEVGPNDNVVAYDDELQIAWRIESTHQRWSPFNHVCEDDDVLVASNHNGCSYEVDSLDGSILVRRAAA